MKLLNVTVCAMALFIMIGGVARADNDPLAAAIAHADQQCKEFQKQKADLERQAAQSQGLTPEQKTQATRTIAELGQVIKATNALLQDPALKATGTNQEVAARLYSTVTAGNMLVRSAQHELGVAPADKIQQVLDTNIEPFLTKVSPGFDASPSASNGDGGFNGEGVGNNFFGSQGNGSTSVVVVGNYKATTPESASAIVGHDGSVGGGVMLEDAAGGLGPISTVTYDARYNALVMDGHLVYFIKMPPWDAAALCREILASKNTLVGVSEGASPKDNFFFGESATYEKSDVAQDLLLADRFLGDITFGYNDWTQGYKFPNGYVPQRPHGDIGHMLVRFAFKNFSFTAKGGQLELANVELDVTLMPVTKVRAPNGGGYLPDTDALQRGYQPPPEFLANAQFITSHVDFLRRERIIAKTLADGELAALFRSYKQAGVNLEALASDLERM